MSSVPKNIFGLGGRQKFLRINIYEVLTITSDTKQILLNVSYFIFFPQIWIMPWPHPSHGHTGAATVSLVLNYVFTSIAISQIPEETISICWRWHYRVYFFPLFSSCLFKFSKFCTLSICYFGNYGKRKFFLKEWQEKPHGVMMA